MAGPTLPPALGRAVARVRLRAEAAFLARLNAGAGFGDPRAATQIFLRDPAATARLGRVAARPSKTHERAAAEVAAALADAERDPDGSRLAVLAERLGLAAGERALAAVAVAYALDPDVRAFVQAMSPRRRGLTLEICAELEPELEGAVALAAAGHPRAALREGPLVTVDDDGQVGATRRLVDWVLGDDRLPPPLDEVAELAPPSSWIAPAVDAMLDELAGWIGAAPVAVAIVGPSGSGRRGVATALAERVGRPLLVAELGDLLAIDGAEPKTGRARGLRAFLTEARLQRAVPLLAGAEALAGEREVERDAIRALRRGPALLLFAAAGRGIANLALDRPLHVVRLPRADLDDRERAWAYSLASVGAAVAPADTAELAARYVIGPGAIAEVAREAGRFAAARRGAVDRAALEEMVGRRLSIRLGSYGSVIARKARFEEMVLPEDVFEAMRDMIAMVRQRSQILERWGYQRHLGIARGVSALFSGDPGTGKTMAASVIASELGLELIRIDLSQVVSKWVGETEKNLARIFDEAQDANAALLFDEADALFGKRTEVRSAQDKYANLEVNYILQRMESFDGVSVLTTNFEGSIDPALQRRLSFRVRFPAPEVGERELLWRKLLPPETGLHAAAPFARLAERFEMTGGYIKNAVVRAAVIAAREGRTLAVDDLWTGAHNEYAEMGKVLSSHTRT